MNRSGYELKADDDLLVTVRGNTEKQAGFAGLEAEQGICVGIRYIPGLNFALYLALARKLDFLQRSQAFPQAIWKTLDRRPPKSQPQHLGDYAFTAALCLI